MLRILGPTLIHGMASARKYERAHFARIADHLAATGKLPPLPRFKVEDHG
jgi:hypothetical protein